MGTEFLVIYLPVALGPETTRLLGWSWQETSRIRVSVHKAPDIPIWTINEVKRLRTGREGEVQMAQKMLGSGQNGYVWKGSDVATPTYMSFRIIHLFEGRCFRELLRIRGMWQLEMNG